MWLEMVCSVSRSRTELVRYLMSTSFIHEVFKNWTAKTSLTCTSWNRWKAVIGCSVLDASFTDRRFKSERLMLLIIIYNQKAHVKFILWTLTNLNNLWEGAIHCDITEVLLVFHTNIRFFEPQVMSKLFQTAPIDQRYVHLHIFAHQ